MNLHCLEIYRITMREMRMSSSLKNQNQSKPGQGIESMQIHDICSGSEIHWNKTSQFPVMTPITGVKPVSSLL